MTTVVYLENALNPHLRRVEMVEPASIRSLAPNWEIPFVAFVDGEPVLRADWELVVEDGRSLAFIDVAGIPQGGDGGGSNPMRIVMMIAVMYVAYQTGVYVGGGLTGAAAQAGVLIAGSALVNTIIPAPKLPSSQVAAALAAPSPTYSVQAQGNTARLDAAIPEHFGRLKVYPDYAAQPYQEYAGNDQFLYALLCIGRGEYTINDDDVFIEDTRISNFSEISFEFLKPGQSPTLFPASVTTSVEVSGQTMPCLAGTFSQAGNAVTVTSAAHGLSTGTVVYVDFGDAVPYSSVWVEGHYEGSPHDNNGRVWVPGYWITVNAVPGATDGTFTILSTPTPDTFTFTNPVSTTTTGNCTISPWLGGFIANASGTLVNAIGLDFSAERGLYYANDDGSLSPVTVHLVAEARTVNAVGAPTGSWTSLTGANDITYSGATTTAQRHSERFTVTPGRYEVRVRRSNVENQESRVGNNIVWASLRTYGEETRDYGDVTLMAVRMKATNNLNSMSSRKINVIATRNLPVWNGTTWSAKQATRSPAWAIAYASKQSGATDQGLDLGGLLALDATCTARGDTFNARFDNFVTAWEALTKIAGAVRAKPFMQGGVLRVMRDQPATIPVAMFSGRNIVKGSFSVNYLMPTDDTADAVDVTYFDETTWATATVRSKLSDSTADQPAKVDLFGVTNRDQAFREGMKIAAENRYRRKLITFKTEMEGFIPSFGDLIAIQHDMPAWGQGGEVVAWNAGTRTATLSEPPVFTTGNHYIGLRKRDGSVDGPYLVTAGADPHDVVLASAPAMTPYTGMAEERTHYAFGWAETWRQPARLVSAKPQSANVVEIVAVNEDSNVHTAETGVTTPVMVTSQLAAYNNAPPLVGLVVSAAPNARHKMMISWVPAPWAIGYIVEQSAGDNTWIRIADTTDTAVSAYAVAEVGTIVRVAAYTLARGAWSQQTYVMPPLENVANLSVSVVQNGVQVTWTKAGDEAYQETELRRGSSWDTGLLVTSKSSTSHLMDWQFSGTLQLWAKNFDTYGRSSVTAVGTSIVISPPAPITINRADVQVNTVALGWLDAKTSQPIKSYSIYTGQAGDALSACTLYGKAGSDSRSDVVIFRSAGAKRIYLIAEDVAGNTSTPVNMDVTVTLPANFVLSSEWDETWSGTKTNAYVEDGALIMLVNPTETWGSHFSSRGWSTTADQVAAGYPLAFQPGTTSASYVEVHDIGKIIPSGKISVSTQSTTLVGSVLPSVLIEWSSDNATWTSGLPGITDLQATSVRYVRVTYSATASGGDDLLKLTRVHVTVSSEELSEFASVTLVSTDASGTLYTCTKPFIDVVSVTVTPSSSSNIARVNAIIDDTVSPAKIYVQAWDTSNVRTSGNVSLQIGGY